MTISNDLHSIRKNIDLLKSIQETRNPSKPDGIEIPKRVPDLKMERRQELEIDKRSFEERFPEHEGLSVAKRPLAERVPQYQSILDAADQCQEVNGGKLLLNQSPILDRENSVEIPGSAPQSPTIINAPKGRRGR